MRKVPIALACLLVALGTALAQSNLGTITGAVTDPAGALMPGVRIEARNMETGTLYKTSSTSTGDYTIAQLPAGSYEISVSQRGFKPYTRTGIAVLGAQTMRIDIVMAMLTSDEILTNESIIQLVKVGIDDDVIISKIQESQYNFDLSVQGMVTLKESGVSDRLMHFLMNPTKPPEPKTASAPAHPKEAPAKPTAPKETPKIAEAPAAQSSPGLPREIGVYFRKGGQWAEIVPEIVTYHTGGMLARLATAGVMQNDVNGRVSGAHSRNVIEAPREFIIVAAEGVAITEYQLIHLHQERNAREFLAVTGGIFSSSGGATRDLLKFEGTKLLARTFSVKLSDLEPGEYGFLLAGAATSSSKVGKIYTFRVTE